MARLFIVSLLGLGVVAGCALVSATQANVSTFYSLGQKADEARAALHLKVQLQPWGADHAYAKFAGSVRVDAIRGVRWAVRASTPGKTHRWLAPGSPRQGNVPSEDDACS